MEKKKKVEGLWQKVMMEREAAREETKDAEEVDDTWRG